MSPESQNSPRDTQKKSQSHNTSPRARMRHIVKRHSSDSPLVPVPSPSPPTVRDSETHKTLLKQQRQEVKLINLILLSSWWWWWWWWWWLWWWLLLQHFLFFNSFKMLCCFRVALYFIVVVICIAGQSVEVVHSSYSQTLFRWRTGKRRHWSRGDW